MAAIATLMELFSPGDHLIIENDLYGYLYNLYEKEKWLPYFTLDNAIWRGKFEPFYSLCNFGPVYSQGLVKKMTDALIMEMRVGIAAARSGKNLPTRFKKKNEVIIPCIMDMMKKMNIKVVSEGIEYEEQIHFLREAGGVVIQGYYFSKPVPPEDFYQTYQELNGHYPIP